MFGAYFLKAKNEKKLIYHVQVKKCCAHFKGSKQIIHIFHFEICLCLLFFEVKDICKFIKQIFIFKVFVIFLNENFSAKFDDFSEFNL